MICSLLWFRLGNINDDYRLRSSMAENSQRSASCEDLARRFSGLGSGIVIYVYKVGSVIFSQKYRQG